MAINLDNLPKEKPEGGNFELVPEGRHLCTIDSATMKVSAAGNAYLELKLKPITGGLVYDMITESDKPALLYKLQRLILACDIPLTGSLELKDVGTLIQGKQLYADIVHKTETYQEKERTKAVVDIFGGDIFYHINSVEQDAVPWTGDEAPTTPPSNSNY